MKKVFAILAFIALTTTSVFADPKPKQDLGGCEKVTTAVSNAVDSGKAAVKTAVSVIDTSSNFRRIYNDMSSGIMGLAQSLKVGAIHVYTVMVKQQLVNAIADLLFVLILFGLSYYLYKLCRSTYTSHLKLCGWKEGERGNNHDLDDTAKGIMSIIIAVLACLTLITAIIVFGNSYHTIIMGFVNPEYGAMQDILNFVRK